jgi:plastocyanin
MRASARTWAVALCALCLLAGALAAVALAAPARRACRASRSSHCSTHACRLAHTHRCPRARPPQRKPPSHGSEQRTPAPPAGSAGPAHPTSTPSGASPPSAPAAPAEGGPTAAEPAQSSAPSPSAPAPARVQVIAKEYSFTLSRPEVPAGEVIVELVNRGEDTHNLHLLEPTAGTEPGALPNTEPGGVRDLKLKLHAGTYTLFCSLPGHEAKGMKATLVVG